MTKPQIKKLDLLWSKRIHERDKVCVVCGKSGLNAHHFIGRRNRQVRWDLLNGVGLCPLHHKLGIQSAHEDPDWFVGRFKERYPDRYEYLIKKKNEDNKFYYEDVLDSLTDKK